MCRMVGWGRIHGLQGSDVCTPRAIGARFLGIDDGVRGSGSSEAGHGMYKLIIEDEGRVTEFQLGGGVTTIGRNADNDIRLDERNVSRYHARLRVETGQVILEDAGSAYGILVNGERMEEETRVLQPGDLFRIGDFSITLEATGPAALRPPPDDDEDDETTDVMRLPTQPSGYDDEDDYDTDVGLTAITGSDADEGPRLVPVDSSSSLPTILLSREQIVLGSSSDADVRLNHESMQPLHAALRNNGGRCSVVNLGTPDAVRLNGRPVGAADLSEDDLVQFGRLGFRFKGGGVMPGPEASAGAPWWLVVALGVLCLVTVAGWILTAASGPNAPEEPDTGPPPWADTRPEANLARLLMEEQRWSEVIDLTSDTLMEVPGDPVISGLRKKALSERKAKAALEEIETLLDSKSLAKAEEKLRSIPEGSVYYQDAKAKIREFKARNARIAELLGQAQAAMEEGLLDQAMGLLDEVVRLDPDSLDAQRLKMQVKLKMRRLAQEGPDAGVAGADGGVPGRVREEKPEDAAEVRGESTGDGAEAGVPREPTEDGAEAGVAREPEGGVAGPKGSAESSKLAIKHFQRGRRLEGKKRFLDAKAEYEAAIQASPTFPFPYRNLGYLLFELGDGAAACRNLAKFLALRPDDPERANVERLMRTQGCPAAP